MRLKKMNSSINANLMGDYNIEGISFELGPSTSRYLCKCGGVSNDGECPVCGNKEYKPRNLNHRNVCLVANGEKTFDKSEDSSLPDNSVYCKDLMVFKNEMTNSFDFAEELVSVVKVNEEVIECLSSKNNYLEVIEKHHEILFGDNYDKIIELAKKLFCSPSQEVTINIFIMANYYYWAVKNKKILFTEDEIYQYRYIFKKLYMTVKNLISKGHILDDIDDVLNDAYLPLFFKEFYLTNDGFDRQYNRGKDFDMSAVTYELETALKYALMHGQLRHSDIISILYESGNKSHDFQIDFVDFFIKNVTFLKGDVLRRYVQVVEDTQNLPIPVPTDVKASATIRTERWMKARGINDTRANLVLECLDRDPIVSLKLLMQRKSLSAEEMEMVNTVI